MKTDIKNNQKIELIKIRLTNVREIDNSFVELLSESKLKKQLFVVFYN